MTASLDRQIEYPDSDGQPMADNTKQFRWIVLLKENLDYLFAENPNVFVAGDLLWYPVEGHPEIRVAPDALVVFGRPKGDRGSYRQWQEEDIPPQVVFEVLSPGNTLKEMTRKLFFYEQYGVEEYYIYDPDRNDFSGFQRLGNRLVMIDEVQGWESPQLGIRFEPSDAELQVFHPDGKLFLTPVELAQQSELNAARAQQEAQRADQEAQRANQEAQRANQEAQRADKLAEKLRTMGIDPNDL